MTAPLKNFIFHIMTMEMNKRGNMSSEDYEIALRLCEHDPEFQKLWEEHQALKDKLRELEEKSRLTSEDEVEIKRIKRLKLWGKDRIATKIRDYKVSPPG